MLNLLSKPLWIFAEQAAQNQMGHAPMGLFAAVLALAYTLRPFADLGLAQYTTRQFAAQPQTYRTLGGQVFGAKLLLGACYLLVLLAFGWGLGYPQPALLILGILGVYHWALSMLELWRAGFQGHQHFVMDGLASILDKVLLTVLVGVAVASHSCTLQVFVWLNVGTLFGATLVFGLICFARYGWLKPTLHWPTLKPILRKSLPFALIMLLFSVQERLAQFMLERLSNAEQSGLFYAAYRWVATFQMYLWTLLPVFFARFAKLQTAPLVQRQALLNLAQWVVGAPMLVVAAFLWLQGDKLLFLLANSTPAQIAYIHQLLKPLALLLAMNGLFNLYSTYLTASGYERYVNWLLTGTVALSGLGLLVFIPHWGALGAAWWMAGSYALLCLAYVGVVALATPLRVPWRVLGQLAVGFGAFLGLYVGLLWGLPTLPWWLPALPACFVMVAVLYGLGTFQDAKSLRSEEPT